MSFLDFCFSSNWERERGWYIKFGYKGENSPKVTYLIFRRGSTGESFCFHGLIDFMLFFLHWLEEPGVPRVSDILLSSTRSKWLWVCLPRALPKNLLSYYFLPLRGRSPHFRFGGPKPIIWLLSSPPLGVRRPEVTKYQHLLISPL